MFGCRVRKDHWKGMSAMERSAIAQQQVQQVAEKKARQQQLLHEDWQYARSQADIARNMASQANQVSVQSVMLLLIHSYVGKFAALCMGTFCCFVHANALGSPELRQLAGWMHSVARVLLRRSPGGVHDRSQLE